MNEVKRIRAEKAELRRESTLKQNSSDVANWPHREEGKSRELAEKQAGLGSGRSAEDALKALEKAEELEEKRGNKVLPLVKPYWFLINYSR